MTVTGLKKCMPTKAWGRFIVAASLPDRDRRGVGRDDWRRPARRRRCAAGCAIFSASFFGGRFDDEVAVAQRLVVRGAAQPLERGFALAAASAPLVTCAARPSAIALRPRATRASSTSIITTGSPATAHACAMPAPMVPAPMTPTVCGVFMWRTLKPAAGRVVSETSALRGYSVTQSRSFA